MRGVITELHPDIDAGPLPRQSAVARLLTDSADLAVQYLYQRPLDANPASLVAALDAELCQRPA
jgi:hypothetical protein